MPTPYLIADSAQVTVLRSLASTAFGKYGLKLPEGVDLEDVYEVSAAGNELAYVSSLGSKRRVGGMFRRFVRADVDVTAQGEDMVPASDVERVLDEAAKRVSGDFFLESDISKAGLGPWVPMVDFHVGDIANVEIWGRVVPLVVTRIEPKSTDHSDNDWIVHVGGQLLSDSEARQAENADIYNAVVSDRRELAGLDGKIRTESNNRKAAIASEALRSDERMDGLIGEVRAFLSGDEDLSLLDSLQAINGQLQEQGIESKPGLVPAYLDLNTRLWVAQDVINTTLDTATKANSRSINLLSLNNHGSWYIGQKYILNEKQWLVFNFSRTRGEILGCRSITVSEGAGVVFDRAGDWDIRLRVNIPPGNTITGTSTGIRLTLMSREGQKLDRSTAYSYNTGWDETLNVSLMCSVPEPGCYVYAEGYASTTTGDSDWWSADTGPELTELSVRQLSVKADD